MVGAMYLLYRWWEKGKHQLPWLAILCMSGATLTKGPVGIILPCFVMGVFMLTQRENFWGIVWRMALTALLSLIIPFCWYYAAYLQGGDEFLRTGEGREHRPIHGQDGIRIAREPGVVQPAYTHYGLVALHLIITVLPLHSAMEEVLEDPFPRECEEGYSAAGVHLARLPSGTLLLLHPEEQAQRLLCCPAIRLWPISSPSTSFG